MAWQLAVRPRPGAQALAFLPSASPFRFHRLCTVRLEVAGLFPPPFSSLLCVPCPSPFPSPVARVFRHDVARVFWWLQVRGPAQPRGHGPRTTIYFEFRPEFVTSRLSLYKYRLARHTCRLLHCTLAARGFGSSASALRLSAGFCFKFLRLPRSFPSTLALGTSASPARM